MSNQIDAAHVRFPGTLKVWRGYEDACELSMKKHTLVLKARWSAACWRFDRWLQRGAAGMLGQSALGALHL
ncbi:hypothetical protein HF209_06485 [Pseudomonas sp. WS 5096]|uniref:Uncharacterized protein n=1 Tax=Pseudomonas cremoris TaxID=2724178 RepID=A0ABR6T496_9PSED|nr:hypothetical protein [Pseudomonas cremoris]